MATTTVKKPTAPAATTPAADTQAIADMIAQAYAQQQAAQAAKIQQAVNEGVANQQRLIDRAPQTYQPMRDQSELQRAQAARALAEYAANRGDSGGIGRMEQLQNSTAGANRLNQIDLQQQNFIDDARREIARLQSAGRAEEAAALASLTAQKLQAQVQQGNADREFGYQQSRDAIANQQWQTQFDYQKGRDAVADKQWQMQFDRKGSGGGGGGSTYNPYALPTKGAPAYSPSPNPTYGLNSPTVQEYLNSQQKPKKVTYPTTQRPQTAYGRLGGATY